VLNREGWDWFWCFFFTACAVLRLARFNVEQAGTSKTYFHGLPSPAAGITLATYYWFSQSPLYAMASIENWPWHQMLRFVMAGLGYLMISNVPYPVMPPVGFRSARGLMGLGVLVIGVAMLIFGELEYFFPLAMAYVAFGLFRGVLLGLIERRHQVPGVGWMPGGRRTTDADIVESVGEDTSEFRRRRRRRRSRDRGDRGDRFDREAPQAPPALPSAPRPPHSPNPPTDRSP
jgi:CDP-diacylglycerol--serine O-phosphatidyltransferase